ncbi:hypothetical protein AAFC00_007014 [Neodothiora populina]|uniref:Uncharacterized protein n=1 Tax=Neodothiora populina TaxID=2781224 RepID=A0ABR3PBY1_9PEZI
MAEPVNGASSADVEMKEEGVEQINPVEAAPPFQPDQIQSEEDQTATTNGDAPESLPQVSGVADATTSSSAATIEPPAAAAIVEAPSVSSASTPQPPPPQQSQQPTTTPATAPTSAAPVTARESSTRPSSIPPTSGIAPPDRPSAHGSPTRVYLNQMVTPHLLEGMKYLAAYEPEKPLLWLSEFLAKRSAECEGE